MKGVVDEIYVTAKGSAQMERVEEVLTIEGCAASRATVTARGGGSGHDTGMFAR